jgi:predicted kinase
MRKWMRERLQRRKKPPAEASDQSAPPPLQPAYFEAEQQPDSSSGAPAAEPEAAGPPSAVEAAEDRQPNSNQPESVSDEPSAKAPSRASGGASRGGGRRRGGRGRGGRVRERAVAQAFAPAAVKGSIPAVADESGIEAAADDLSGTTDPQGPASDVAAPQVPAVGAAAPPRAPKGIVVLAIGLPGSGKSSWFKRHNVVPLSSDMVRSLLFDDVREQRYQDLVFSNLRSMLKARLIARRPMNYVDATNLTPQERQHWIKLAKDYQYEVHAVFFDVPLEVCVERHQRRDRVVPEDVMRRMAAKLKPPTFEEGFAKITVVRVKKKDLEAG